MLVIDELGLPDTGNYTKPCVKCQRSLLSDDREIPTESVPNHR